MHKINFKYWTDTNHFPHIKEAWGSFIIRRSFDEKKNPSKKPEKDWWQFSSFLFYFPYTLTFFLFDNFSIKYLTQRQKTSNIKEED